MANTIQKELAEWQIQRFGVLLETERQIYRMNTGISEELGELAEAVLLYECGENVIALIGDALADCAIYVTQLATAVGVVLSDSVFSSITIECADARKTVAVPKLFMRLQKQLGVMSHYVLKYEEKDTHYKYTHDAFFRVIERGSIEVISLLSQIGSCFSLDFKQVLRKTMTHVMTRRQKGYGG